MNPNELERKTQEANQRLFNEAWNHITAQGAPSTTVGVGCAYRGSGDLSCAFAPAIEEYHDFMESKGAATLLDEYSEYLHPWVRECDYTLANDVQRAHDDPAFEVEGDAFVAAFQAEMRDIAKTYGLEVPDE